MPNEPKPSQPSQDEASPTGCRAYYADRCESCPRYRVYCKASSGFCVCSERCPICSKSILFSSEKYWVTARLIARGLL